LKEKFVEVEICYDFGRNGDLATNFASSFEETEAAHEVFGVGDDNGDVV
jgi:hypothetical protein